MTQFNGLRMQAGSLTSRRTTINAVIRLLTSGAPSVLQRFQSGAQVFAVTGGPPRSEDIRDWSFRTPVDGVSGSYTEFWNPVRPQHSEYVLGSSHFYLLLRMPLGQGPREILAFHGVSDSGQHSGRLESEYGRLPHFHIRIAPDPVGKAHFAVELVDAEQSLGSIDQFDEMLQRYLKMVAHELLLNDEFETLVRGAQSL